MYKINVFKTFISVIFLTSFFAFSCSREVPQKLSFSIDLPSTAANGSLNTGSVLDIAIVNLRATPTSPAKPYFFNRPIGTNELATGQKFTITITDEIPVSKSMMVQLLLVFSDGTTKAMKFAYGDTLVDSAQSGEVVAKISPLMHGDSSKEGRVAGRYVLGQNTGVYYGPTGKIFTEFNPGGGKPPMIVDSSEIVNGWFSVMILNGTQATGTVSDLDFKYRMVSDAGITSFLFATATGPMNLSNPYFNGSHPDNQIAKVLVPTSYKLENYGTVKRVWANGPSEYIVGWFVANPADAASYFSTKKSCEPGASQMLIPGLFADENLDSPIAFSDTGTHASYAKSLLGVAASGDPGCFDPALIFKDSLNIFPHRMGEGRDGVFAFYPPFSSVDLQSSRERFMEIQVDKVASPPNVFLNMRFLEDTWGVKGVHGISIFMRRHNGGNSDGGGDDEFGDCRTRAEKYGFSFKKDYVAASPDSPPLLDGKFSVFIDAPVGYSQFSSDHADPNSVYNWEYMACPFRHMPTGGRRYFSRGVREGCIGSCEHESLFGFGKKIALGSAANNVTVTSPTFFTAAPINGVTSRILNVTPAGEYTELEVTSAAYGSLVEGDEILVLPMGQNGDGCFSGGGGSGGGEPLSARVHGKVVTNKILIKRGSFVDDVSNTYIIAPMTDPNFCYLQVVKVVHTGNLTLSTSGSISAAPFNGDNEGGGVVALRVSGVLDISSTTETNPISANGKGYNGGVPAVTQAGMTSYGPHNAGYTSFTDTCAGAGGAHVGFGGNGGTIDTTFTSGQGSRSYGSGWGDWPQAIFSFGGGGHPSCGPAPSILGGRGGGVVFLVANKVNVGTSQKVISANGLPGDAGGSSRTPGGGGAGGSVIFLSKSILGSLGGGIKTQVNGGNSGVPMAAGTREVSGGGGGGGFARFYHCPLLLATGVTVASEAQGGVIQAPFTDQNVSYPPQNGQWGDASAAQTFYQCP